MTPPERVDVAPRSSHDRLDAESWATRASPTNPDGEVNRGR
jgi:hypothetical protein